MTDKTTKNKLSDAIDKLYNINASISASTYIQKKAPTLGDMENINRLLAQVIKELREGVDERCCVERKKVIGIIQDTCISINQAKEINSDMYKIEQITEQFKKNVIKAIDNNL